MGLFAKNERGYRLIWNRIYLYVSLYPFYFSQTLPLIMIIAVDLTVLNYFLFHLLSYTVGLNKLVIVDLSSKLFNYIICLKQAAFQKKGLLFFLMPKKFLVKDLS